MPEQSTLFQLHGNELTPPTASEQQRQLDRVSSNIAESVMDFLWIRGTGGTFTMNELHEHVAKRHPTAPASADRILRDLRQQNRVQYSVQRAKSLYQILYLGE